MPPSHPSERLARSATVVKLTVASAVRAQAGSLDKDVLRRSAAVTISALVLRPIS
jgi:hypothetical protein